MNTESTAIVALILVLMVGFFVFIYMGQQNPSQNDAALDQSTSGQSTSFFSNRDIDDLIKVTSPLPNQQVSSPLIIEGKARGYWFFEADFPIMLANERGDIIARGLAIAQSDWMTNDFVQFRAELEFSPGFSKTGTIILRNNNPSDLIENSAETRIPIIFGAQRETMTVQVFFGNRNKDSNILSNKVFATPRSIPKTQSVARAVLEELLKGPNQDELALGFYTNINNGVKIQSISIVNGIAKVDFNKQLDYQVAGSARVGAIRAQITETLKQFPTVKDVIISIDNRTEDILQP